MKLKTIAPLREDKAGSGRFGAPRGSRTHTGIDLVIVPGSKVLCPIHGKVTKHGTVYTTVPHFEYVQVTDEDGNKHRFYYTHTFPKVGTIVHVGDVLAIAADVTTRYPNQGMKPHVHYEIKKGKEYLDPYRFEYPA